MVEYPALARVVLSGDVDACLLVQPPVRQREVVRDDTLRARRSPRAVKARSISARPERTSPASVTRRPGPGPTGRRHACETLPERRPVPRPAGLAVPPETRPPQDPGLSPRRGSEVKPRGKVLSQRRQQRIPSFVTNGLPQHSSAPQGAVSLAAAQLVIARELGSASWPCSRRLLTLVQFPPRATDSFLPPCDSFLPPCKGCPRCSSRW
jgi:hypothetical protein